MMNGTFTDKVVRFLNNAKQTVEKALIKGQEIVTDIRIEKLSKLSKKTIVSIGAIALTAIVICGAFALSGEQKSKGPEDALLNAQLSAAPEEETVEDPATVYYAIEIDGVPVAALPTEAEAEAVLDGVIAHYTAEGAEIINVEYNETVEIVQKEGKDPEFMSVEDACSLIVTGTKEPKVYTVAKGDCLWDIAVKNGMSVDELIVMNPHADVDHLRIGSTLNLYELKPFINVTTTERLTATERIDYNIVYEETSTLYKGEIKVKTPGVYGQRQVTKEIVRENGMVVATTDIESTVISEPSTQVNLKGTKSLSTLVGTGSFSSPMGHLEISSGFGSRGGGRHTGVDLRNPKGTPIYVVDDGVVTFAGYRGSYGNIVKVSHGNGIETWYGHCDTMSVSIGDVVKKGQQIATVGRTGRATGYHLHFEVRKNGVPQNPMNYL
ncbi:MAG: peptidoglycan DD-metalloendopeptidase family protein [Clostridiales Family XIII bacterium]|nr:peptidoglycan DD-metalloendopeptidase family protein [Clostridiales Family XIII bacterium]